MTTLEGHTLARTTILALERMAFILTEEITEEHASEFPPPKYHIHIAFTGAGQRGDLFLSASEGFLREFTTNMLGLEDKDVEIERQGPESLAELSNVVGGEIILMLGGADVDYKLGRPEPVTREEAEKVLREVPSPLSCFLETEGEIFSVKVVLRNEQD